MTDRGKTPDSCLNCQQSASAHLCLPEFQSKIAGKVTSYAASAQTGWIPVEERLPAENGEYLVMCEVGIDPVDYFLGSMSWESIRSYGVNSESHTRYGVTHWMPLPAPPAESAAKETRNG